MEPAKSQPALVVNPSAGLHPITGNPDELAAALRAAERTWARFPYYELRYGERGRQFAHSDSGWLARLPELGVESMFGQLRWLGRVLSSRGMPQWLLEHHLQVLHEELAAAVPERAPQYASLVLAADSFREARQAVLPEETFQQLADSFSPGAGEWSRHLPEMGQLLVAAVVDERLGIHHTVSSMESWAADESRFPREWIEAVRSTLQQARSAVIPRYEEIEGWREGGF